MEQGSLNKKQEKERFEIFLFEMDDVLEPFIEEAARQGFTLDYTLQSLDQLERFYLAHKASAMTQEEFIQRAARYFGETVRHVYGGKWQLEIENPRHLFYGLPVLTGHAPTKVKLCPLQSFRLFSRGKPQGFLREVVEGQVHPVKLDLTPE